MLFFFVVERERVLKKKKVCSYSFLDFFFLIDWGEIRESFLEELKKLLTISSSPKIIRIASHESSWGSHTKI